MLNWLSIYKYILEIMHLVCNRIWFGGKTSGLFFFIFFIKWRLFSGNHVHSMLFIFINLGINTDFSQYESVCGLIKVYVSSVCYFILEKVDVFSNAKKLFLSESQNWCARADLIYYYYYLFVFILILFVSLKVRILYFYFVFIYCLFICVFFLSF